MPQGPIARLGDPVMHPAPPVLTGPPAVTVLIGGQPAWKGIPLALGPGLQLAQQATESAIKVAENIAIAAQAAAVAAAGTPGAPAAVAAAAAARLAAETLKASSAASMGAGIAAAAAGGASIHTCATPWPIPPHGPGVVIDGSPTVLINNMPACRMLDTIVEAIGPPSKIMMGFPTVIVGNSGSGGGGGGGGLAGIVLGLALAGLDLLKGILGLKYPRQEFDKNGKLVTRYNEYITIEGSPEYQAAVVRDLIRMEATKSGKLTLDEFAKTGKHMTIRPVPPGGAFDNGACDYADPADNAPGRGQPDATGKPGKGADGVIEYNPSLTNEYTGTDGKTYTQEPFEVLNHEMIHGVHQAQGNDLVAQKKPFPYSNKEEMQTIGANDGIDDYSKGDMTEAALSKEQGDSPRPDHDSVTKSTYQDGSGNWHESTTDAAGNKTDKVIPGPPGGGTPSK